MNRRKTGTAPSPSSGIPNTSNVAFQLDALCRPAALELRREQHFRHSARGHVPHIAPPQCSFPRTVLCACACAAVRLSGRHCVQHVILSSIHDSTHTRQRASMNQSDFVELTRGNNRVVSHFGARSRADDAPSWGRWRPSWWRRPPGGRCRRAGRPCCPSRLRRPSPCSRRPGRRGLRGRAMGKVGVRREHW